MRWYQHSYHTPTAHGIVFATIPHLPKFLHPPIAAVTALIFFALLKAERAAVAGNLERVCGAGRLRRLWKTYRVFYSFCDFIVSYCYVPRASDAELVAMLANPNRGADQIDRCLGQGNGLIVWTAHVGNWEFASRLLELHGRPVNTARYVETDNAAEAMLRGLMTNERLRIVQLNDDPLASMKLLASLRANEIVAMQGDRAFQAHAAKLPLFGEEAEFPLGPFLLAYFSGAPVLPGLVVREGWLRYRVIMGEPIIVARTGDREQAARAGLEIAVRFLEENLRRYHDQWLNFYDFWRARASSGGN